MKFKNAFIFIVYLAALIVGVSQSVRAENWERMSGTQGGGVPEKIIYVCHDNLDNSSPPNSVYEPSNQVWAASMGNGIYRTTVSAYQGYPDNLTWATWTERQPGKKCFGVDAIEVGGVEHVLSATGGMGGWYTNSTGSFSFDRTGNPLAFPDAWRHACLHDAAFFWPTSGNPTDPENHYYVILTSAAGENAPGIYYWDGDYHTFIRIVEEGNTSQAAATYSHFYRDLANKNVVYATSDHAIYKLSGPYGRETLEKLPSSTKLEDLPIAKPPKNLPVIK
jgi:hypothetical protein